MSISLYTCTLYRQETTHPTRWVVDVFEAFNDTPTPPECYFSSTIVYCLLYVQFIGK